MEQTQCRNVCFRRLLESQICILQVGQFFSPVSGLLKVTSKKFLGVSEMSTLNEEMRCRCQFARLGFANQWFEVTRGVSEVKLYLMILTMLNKEERALDVLRGPLGGQ